MVAFARQYDLAGNMTSDRTLKYTYDAWNRQTAVNQADDTPVETYIYDGVNRRIRKNYLGGTGVIGQPEYYYNHQWQLLEERGVFFDGATLDTTQYIWSQRYIDSPVVRFYEDTGNSQYNNIIYYTGDANHNVTALVNTSGAVVERYYYDPYGKATICNASWVALHHTGWEPLGNDIRDGSWSAYGNNILYCGYFYDGETEHDGSVLIGTSGNYLARNRYYSTIMAAWFVRDPIQADINLYRYVHNNPLILTDPLGLAECDCPPTKKECDAEKKILNSTLDKQIAFATDGKNNTVADYERAFATLTTEGGYIQSPLFKEKPCWFQKALLDYEKSWYYGIKGGVVLASGYMDLSICAALGIHPYGLDTGGGDLWAITEAVRTKELLGIVKDKCKDVK